VVPNERIFLNLFCEFFLKVVEKIEVRLKCKKKGHITWKPTYVDDNIMSMNFLGIRKIFTEGPRENGKTCRDKFFPAEILPLTGY
jgi:hypothetical protein